MNWYEVLITSKKDIREELTTLFIINGIDDLLIEDGSAINDLHASGIEWDYIDEGVEKAEDIIKYKAHFNDEENDVESLFSRIKKGLEEMKIDVESCSFYQIDPDANKDKWKEFFKPFEICDGIVVCPSWEEYEAKADERVLFMDPGSAFGTGSHETTRLCAGFINKYLKGGETILDIGSGSGILSVISIFKGASRVKAVDIDELALKASIENAKKNNVSDKIDVEYADEDYGVDYDIIVSNLTTPILMELGSRIYEASKVGGYLLASGILTSTKTELIEKYKQIGFELLEDTSMGEWTGLVFKK